MEIEVKPVHPSKAPWPILITVLGIESVFNPVWLYAIKSGIVLTLSPITRVVSGQSLNHASLLSLGEPQPSALKVTVVKPAHPSKAPLPIVITELPIVSVFNPAWLYAIKLGIDLTLSPIIRVVSGQSINHAPLLSLCE